MVELLVEILRALFIFGALIALVPLLVLANRRVAAAIQSREGPDRVGPQGVLQPLADIIKLLAKEDIRPPPAYRALHALGPLLAFLPAALAFAAVPVGRNVQVVDISVGALFVLAVTLLSVHGAALGGWASDSRQSLLASLRSSAQTMSFDVVMILAAVSILMIAGDVRLSTVVEEQAGLVNWNMFRQPLACIIFLVAALARNRRPPFDAASCGAELAGDLESEFSGAKFAMYRLGEYLAMVVLSSLLVTLFLGGWDPGLFALPDGALGTSLSVAVFFVKLALVLFLHLWVSWTLPRLRYDRLMDLGWKRLVPLAMANIVVTGAVVAVFDSLEATR